MPVVAQRDTSFARRRRAGIDAQLGDPPSIVRIVGSSARRGIAVRSRRPCVAAGAGLAGRSADAELAGERPDRGELVGREVASADAASTKAARRGAALLDRRRPRTSCSASSQPSRSITRRRCGVEASAAIIAREAALVIGHDAVGDEDPETSRHFATLVHLADCNEVSPRRASETVDGELRAHCEPP
jgi:hypothetical protein